MILWMAFFMIPVDIPLVKTNTINSLENEYLKGNAGIIYPVFNVKKRTSSPNRL